MKKYILATFALIAMCFSAMAAKPNNAFQLNYKNETVAPLQARLLGNPRFVFSEDGSEITFYKGANPANMVIKVDSVNSLAYIYMPHVHNLTLVADTVLPTDETTGTLAYWECVGTAEDPSCTLYFADSLGTQEIGNDSLLNIWLAKGGNGFLKCVYDSAYFYAVVNGTLIVRADRIGEIKNENRDSVDYFVMTYTLQGEPQTFEAEATSMRKVVFKTGDDNMVTTPVLGAYTYTDNNGTYTITLSVNPEDETDYIITSPSGLPDGSQWHATFDPETNTLTCAGVEVGYENYGNQFGDGIVYGWYNRSNLYVYGYLSFLASTSEDGSAPLVFNLDDEGYITGVQNVMFGAYVYQGDAQGDPQHPLGWGYLIKNGYEFSYKGAANAPMRSNAGNADLMAVKAVKAVKASLIDKKELVEKKNIRLAY